MRCFGEICPYKYDCDVGISQQGGYCEAHSKVMTATHFLALKLFELDYFILGMEKCIEDTDAYELVKKIVISCLIHDDFNIDDINISDISECITQQQLQSAINQYVKK
jgi:translation elongation factor EF-Tu-like GTPase